jgi:hypothetical protein
MAESQIIEPILLSAADAAKSLGVSVRLLQKLNSAGQFLPPVKLGRRCLWSIESLREFVRLGCPSREKFELLKKGAGQ